MNRTIEIYFLHLLFNICVFIFRQIKVGRLKCAADSLRSLQVAAHVLALWGEIFDTSSRYVGRNFGAVGLFNLCYMFELKVTLPDAC